MPHVRINDRWVDVPSSVTEQELRRVGGVYRIPRAAICHKLGCDPPSICAVGGGRTCDLVRKSQADQPWVVPLTDRARHHA